MSTSSYSSDGPECPDCGFTFTPDEGIYYDAFKYTEDECPECRCKFKVDVQTHASWLCTPVSDDEQPPEKS